MTTKADKFQDFDTKLLSIIKRGDATTFKRMCAVLHSEAEALAAKSGEGWRVIDRRLQALRKRGFIKSLRAGHVVVWNLTQ